VGDIVDFDFLAGVFKVSMSASRRQNLLSQLLTSRSGGVGISK
jgi:hypothetical protein